MVRIKAHFSKKNLNGKNQKSFANNTVHGSLNYILFHKPLEAMILLK